MSATEMLQNNVDQQEVLESSETKAVDKIKENPQANIIENNENLKDAQEGISLSETMKKEQLTIDDMRSIMAAHVTFKDFRDFKPLIDNTPNALNSIETVLSSPNLSLDEVYVCSDFLHYLEDHQKDCSRTLTFQEGKTITELKNIITTKEQIFINLDYSEVFPTVESNIKTALLDPNIISNIDAPGGKRVANPSQLYADYLKFYANQKGVKISELSLEDRQNAVYDVYKQDMLDSVEWTLKQMNNATNGSKFLEGTQKNVSEYKIENIVLLLAKNSQGKEIYNLCDFLIKNGGGGRTSFSDIQKVGFSNNPNETQQQALKSMFNSLLAVEQAYYKVVRDGDGKNENAYIVGSESFNNMPGNFIFYGENEIVNKLSDLYQSYLSTKQPTSLRFENKTVRRVAVNSYMGDTKENLTGSSNTVSHTEDKTSFAMFVSGSTVPKYMDFEKYTSWLAKHGANHSSEYMSQYLNNPNTPLITIQEKIDRIGMDNIAEIQLDATVNKMYGDALKKNNPNIEIKTGATNYMVLKNNVESVSTESLGEQFFYRGDATSEADKTKELVGNTLTELPNILDRIKNTEGVDQDSVKVVISSGASNITYNGVYKDNQGLSEARANNVESGILSGLPTAKIEKHSEVAGPVYPPTAELLQKYFPDGSITMENRNKDDNLDAVEEAIYREYQYVKIDVVYNKKTTLTTLPETFSFVKPKNNYQYFGFEFTNPGVSTVAANSGKNTDRSSIDMKAQKEISQKLR